MRTSGRAPRRGAKKASGRRASAVVFGAVASLFFLLSPLLAYAANNSSPSSSSSPPPFLAAATSPNGDRLENWSLTSTIVPPPAAAPSGSGGKGGSGGDGDGSGGGNSNGNGGESVVFVEPATVEEVQRIVRNDNGAYPSPLLTVGSGHSSGEVVSLFDPRARKFRGTVLKTTNLKGTSLERRGGRSFVRVGAGVELADLHDWLAERGLEISASPEIGDATVGSAAAASTKDSSVCGGVDDGDFGDGESFSSTSSSPSSPSPSSSPSSSSSSSPRPRAPPYPASDLYKGMGDGYLGALVRGLRYVDASGALVALDARGDPGGADAREIRRIGSSFGLLGPVVDVLLETRPLALVETRVKIVPLEDPHSDLDFAEKILKLRDEADNIMILISLGGVAQTGSLVSVAPNFKPFAYVEMRTRRRGEHRNVVPLLDKVLLSWWLPETIRKTKYDAFAKGSIPSWLLTVYRIPLLGRVLDAGAAATTHRNFFVNRYRAATPGLPRLSFTYYELVDANRFAETYAALLGLAADFRRRTGWAPGALAIYFVRRSGSKEAGNYSGSKGVSCTLDPVTGAPGDPRFKQFLAESDALIQSLGGRLSPSQSLPSAIEDGNGNNPEAAAADFGDLDQSMVKGESGARFATPYLKRVFAADARAQELKRKGRWEAFVGAQRG